MKFKPYKLGMSRDARGLLHWIKARNSARAPRRYKLLNTTVRTYADALIQSGCEPPKEAA